jgi:hypothetical protein
MRFQAGLTIIEWRLLQLLEFVDWHKEGERLVQRFQCLLQETVR